MKRFLSILLCLVLVICLFPAQSYAEKTLLEPLVIGSYYDDDPSDELYHRFTNPLSWLIIKKQNGKALLICADVIDVLPFDDGDGSSWEDLSIRYWLNHYFYDFAFL